MIEISHLIFSILLFFLFFLFCDRDIYRRRYLVRRIQRDEGGLGARLYEPLLQPLLSDSGVGRGRTDSAGIRAAGVKIGDQVVHYICVLRI